MPETMTALVQYGSEPGSVEIREVAVPEVGEEDVLFRVDAVGICGSDLHQWHGTHSWPVNYPVILGHEFAGTVARAGRRVSGFAEGDRVVSETAAVIDPFSPLSRQGLYNLDPSRLGFGYGVDGAMANFVRVPERCLHRLPEGLAPEIAALTEPCCVAYNTVCVNARIRPGDLVLVIGPGPIGLLCAAMAKLSGAGPLVVAGLPADASRLAIARELGADLTVERDVPACIHALGDGLGADVVIDAAGISQTLRLALDVVRPGGQISKVGWGREPANFSLDSLVQKNVTLQGSFSHNWPIWERVLRMLSTGQIDTTPLVSRVAPLAQWEDSFTGMMEGRYCKVVLTPNS